MADAVCCLQTGFGARRSAGAMVFTLWTAPNNKNANKGLITAQYVGVKVDVPANFEMGKTNKSPEFLKKNPNGKVCLAAMLFMQLTARPTVQACAPETAALQVFSFCGKASGQRIM